MAKNLPDERVVYLSLRGTFSGTNAHTRRSKVIRKLIEKHQHDDVVSDLVWEHGIDDICTLARVLLHEGIFSSVRTAERRFPGVSDGPEESRTPKLLSDLCGRCKKIDFDKIFCTQPESG
ncbi:hypothetical protein K469DRAFT_288201 [Zopfia rhizophila CBS 207.26]|uniref:Uncharacterized protein n=1 Tax=Zopfia rhizophila CBS 207.26 TaxID=1314779 RepID=A0A6A6EQK0_9PEZI|nr:hypothetical protein K469DRAFT_288201 [Zopfia rhizophila CBS 207.26]